MSDDIDKLGETRVTIKGPLGTTVKVYETMRAAVDDSKTWSAEYERQWRAMPWTWRLWTRVRLLFGGES